MEYESLPGIAYIGDRCTHGLALAFFLGPEESWGETKRILPSDRKF